MGPFIVIWKVTDIEAVGQVAVLKTFFLRVLTEARAQYKELEDLAGVKKQKLEFDSVLSGGEVTFRTKNELIFEERFPLPPV